MTKLKGVFLKKSEFDHKAFSARLEQEDIVKVCNKLGISTLSGRRYKAPGTKHRNNKVPVLFIEEALKVISEREDRQKKEAKRISDLLK